MLFAQATLQQLTDWVLGGAGRSTESVAVFMRTHPATDDRLHRMQRLAADRRWAAEGTLAPLAPLAPLPPALQSIRDARGAKVQPGE